MPKQTVSDLLLHNFPENGVKFLLHNPANLRELLRLLATRNQTLPDLSAFDFDRRTIEPDTFIRSDFSHGVTDLLVRVPYRARPKSEAHIKVYLLFEHLSTHQRHIVPRSLGYAMDAYRLQERRWLESHDSLQSFLYEPVVPIVIYTGERVWQAPTPFHELVQGGETFAAFIPATEPMFLSIPGVAAEELARHAGAFGTVMQVLQQRHAVIEEFHRLLTKAVGTVEGEVGKDQHRLMELLSYLAALVYHFRNVNERESLRDELERSIHAQTVRKEIHSMGQTIAEALREEGERKGKIEGERIGKLEAKQETLLLLLRHKFGKKVTPAIVATIRKTADLATLDEWLGRFVEAEALEDVGISGRK